MQSPATKLSEERDENAVTQARKPIGTLDEVRVESIFYPLAIAASISTWMFAIRTPLWLDETISYWQIAGGFSELWARQGAMFVAYPFVLWLAKSVLGTSEFALRLPSILAMLAATYILHKTAKELFGRAGAATATVIFCTHPSVVFGAIDARPYAFATLSVTASIYLMLRWVRTSSNRDAALLGVTSALIVYFHLLYAMILPAFAIYLWLESRREPKRFRPNWGVAIGTFAVLCIPVVGLILKMFQTRATHSFSNAPTLKFLVTAFAADYILAAFAVTALLASTMKRYAVPTSEREGASSLALLVGFVPLLGFFLVSVLTPVHMFLSRYYLVAVPGIALCWGMMVSRIDSKWLRAGFCTAVALVALIVNFNSEFMGDHGYSWKGALEAADENAAPDKAPVLICSDLPESDQLETVDPKSAYLAPLSYYKINAPVVGLSRSLTPASRREIDRFLQQATSRKQRFLVVAYQVSYGTVRYIMGATEGTFEEHRVGVYDHVGIVEFRPK